MTNSVPIIDIAPWLHGTEADRDAVARSLKEACETWGFFILAGHGIDPATVARMQATSRAFFDLPLDLKLRSDAQGGKSGRGYYRMEAKSLARTLGDKNAPGDLRESFRIGAEPTPDRPVTLAPEAAGHFTANTWPADMPEMAPLWREYFAQCDALAAEVLRICARALGLPDTWFDDKVDHASSSIVAQNYPAMEKAPVPGQIRNGAHTDFGTLTLLLAEDRPGGLQVMSLDGEWCDVRPVPGTFIVNLGDMMSQWTNDRWRSTLHRVVNPPANAGSAARRMSVVFFHQPNYDASISCIPTCQDDDHPPKYPPILAGEHIAAKLKAVESVAKPVAEAAAS